MINFKKITRLLLSAGIIMTLATGCGTKDKDGAREAADAFLQAVKDNNQESVNSYMSSAVATGDFASIIDAESFKSSFLEDAGGTSLSEEAQAKVEEFSNKLNTMVTSYEIKDVTINDDKSATVIASVTTAFSIEATETEAFQQKLNDAINQYNTDNYDNILEMTEQQGEEAAKAKIYEDLTLMIIDMYDSELSSSNPESYAITLTLQKNAETGNWYVTNIQDLDSSVSGTSAPATETATTETTTPSTEEVIDASSSDSATTETSGN